MKLVLAAGIALVLGIGGLASPRGETTAASMNSTAASSSDDTTTVAYNVESQKFHRPECKWARKCTKNCINVPRSEAIKRGGKPCKVCGG